MDETILIEKKLKGEIYERNMKYEIMRYGNKVRI
jgi:hypothetical protein